MNYLRIISCPHVGNPSFPYRRFVSGYGMDAPFSIRHDFVDAPPPPLLSFWIYLYHLFDHLQHMVRVATQLQKSLRIHSNFTKAIESKRYYKMAMHGHSAACCSIPPIVSKGYEPKGKYETIGGLKTCRSTSLSTTAIQSILP